MVIARWVCFLLANLAMAAAAGCAPPPPPQPYVPAHDAAGAEVVVRDTYKLLPPTCEVVGEVVGVCLEPFRDDGSCMKSALADARNRAARAGANFVTMKNSGGGGGQALPGDDLTWHECYVRVFALHCR